MPRTLRDPGGIRQAGVDAATAIEDTSRAILVLSGSTPIFDRGLIAFQGALIGLFAFLGEFRWFSLGPLKKTRNVSGQGSMDAMSELTSNRVVVGMSGGVDSSAAAAVLIEKGYEVIGITLKLWPQDWCVPRRRQVLWSSGCHGCLQVSHQLKIPYYLVDESADFQQHVIQYFMPKSAAGRTPNPCVMCNEKLKFGTLLERARQLGAHWIATGHYARVVHGQPQDRAFLKRA